MIKRILYTFLSACLLATGFAGCDDDAMAPLPESVPLIMEVSGKSFVMGDKLVLTIKVNDEDNPEAVSNEDFDIYLTAKDGTEDVSKVVFKDFPSMVTFPKGVSELKIELPIVESGLKAQEKVYVNVLAFVRGYKVSDSSQSIVVSDHNYTVVSLKNNADNEINEGDKFTIQAQVSVPVTDDVDVNISIPDAQKVFYETLPPAKLTIKAGEQLAEAVVKTKHNPDPSQHETLVLDFTTLSGVHPLDKAKIEILMKDLEVGRGDRLLDERWVYDRPAVPFASSGRQGAVADQYGEIIPMKEMNSHPNADLAAEGWKFYNAWEFHSVGNSGDMWNDGNAFKNKVPLFLAARNTAVAQNHAAVFNEQFSNITEEGILKMIQMKVPSTATGGGKGEREYGTAAFYACGTGSPWKSNSQLILEGCRMEVRARLRGEKNGFNMGIWLMSDDSGSSPTYSEVDILENPVGPITGNKAFQTFHYGLSANENKGSKSAQNSINMNDWNVYWMEWRSGEEIALGINGVETVCLKKSECSEEDWTFTNAKNQKGLKFILTMGAPNKWALGGGTETGGVWAPDAGWDSGFASFNNYERDRDNDAIPRLEIDWVRTYINKASVADYEQGQTKNGTKFY